MTGENKARMSKLSRRRFLRGLGAAAAGAALAACQPKTVVVEKEVEKIVKETVVVEKEVAAPAKEPVTVTMHSKSGDMRALQDCYDNFNASQDWITVECSKTTHDKMMANWAAGTGPDLMRTGTIELTTPVMLDAIVPLQPYLDAEGKDFEWMYDIAKPWISWPLGGDVYIMPWQGGPFVCYYNKDHFDEAGVAYPDPDWTWDDYGSIAQKLTKVGGDGIPTQMGSFNWPTMWWNSWLIPLLQAGGVPFDDPAWQLNGYNDPDFAGQNTMTLPGHSEDAMVQALQFQHDLIYKWQACPRPGFEMPEGAGFLSGNISLDFGAPNYASNVISSDKVVNWGVAPPPRAPTSLGRHASQSYVAGFTLGAHSEHKDAAWEAAKYLYSEGGRKCNWGLVRFWAWYQDLEEWIAARPGMDESFMGALEFAGSQDAVFIPRLKDFNRFFNEAVDPWSDLVFTDEMSPKEAVQNMITEGNAVLAEM